MREVNERPVCHRSEDLVAYLYGEASAADALDFRNHLQRCDACRNEFTIFNHVHESIVSWRHEALGTSFNPTAVTDYSQTDSTAFVHHERKLSAAAALREFFSVAPLWLRGATVFAGLLLCALIVFAVSRVWQQPAPMAANGRDPKVFTKPEFDAAVAQQVKIEKEKLEQTASGLNQPFVDQKPSPRTEVAVVRTSSKPRIKGLTLAERQQLAADLRLIPTDEEELPLAEEQPNP